MIAHAGRCHRGCSSMRYRSWGSVVPSCTDCSSRRRPRHSPTRLSDVLAVGVLEIRPPAARDGWALRIRVEDRLGPRLPEDEDAPGEEEEIDLATFETEFIQPERGTPEVLLDAEDAHAKARFSQVFKQMLTGGHRSAAKR